MPQLNVQAPTFTNIYQTFQPTGGASDDKHVRFENAKGLYTSQKASTATVSAFFGSSRLQDRAQKRADGADQVYQAIAREYPAEAARIFSALARDHPQIDFNQGLRRGDLAHIQATIATVLQQEQHLAGASPRSLRLADDPQNPQRLSGDMRGNYSQASMQSTFRYVDDSLRDLQGMRTIAAQGLPTVAEQFMKDLPRSEIRLGGTLLQDKGPVDARATLARFTGNDAESLGLSMLVSQQMLTGLNIGTRDTFTSEDGHKLMPRIGNPLDGQQKNQFVNVTRQGNDYVIDYRVAAKLNGFAAGMSGLATESDESTVMLGMQLTISAADLRNGNLTAYRVTGPPAYDLHVEVDRASLARQAAGGV